MHSKKILGVGAIAAAAALLVSCSSGPTSDDGGDDGDQKSIALVTGTKGSPFYEAMLCGAQDAADQADVQLTHAAGDTWGAALQLPVLDSVAAQSPDALLVVPTDVDALSDRLKSISDTGAPVVVLDQRLNDESFQTARIGSDDEEGGREAAKALADLIGGKGKVMAISSPPGTDAQYVRVEGFQKELEENYPDIEYLGVDQALNDVTKAAGFVTARLASDPDLAGVFVANDVNAIGAVAGLEEAGAVGKVKVVAYDAADTEVEALREGSVQALIAQDPYVEGQLGVETALKALDGEEVETEVSIPLTRLTLDDEDGLEEYLARNGGC
jgi:ribose transport system substrate-binding protein